MQTLYDISPANSHITSTLLTYFPTEIWTGVAYIKSNTIDISITGKSTVEELAYGIVELAIAVGCDMNAAQAWVNRNGNMYLYWIGISRDSIALYIRDTNSHNFVSGT